MPTSGFYVDAYVSLVPRCLVVSKFADYFSADYRYIIFEEVGCFPSTRFTVVTIGTFSAPLLAITLLSTIYGGAYELSFLKRQIDAA